MVARTARMESANIGNIRNALELGTDIVECISADNTCGVCAKFRGRWYSISGESKEYPALYKTALSKGYNVIHPNCRCEFVPVILGMYTEEEIAEQKRKSNQPFEDSRTMHQKIGYDKWQAVNRQLWNEQREYKELQSKYGDKMPYKTLGSFRRAVRADAAGYKKLHYIDRDTAEYEEWRKIIPKDIPSDIDKFQEIKYNENDRYNLMKDYKNSIDKGKISPLVSFNQYYATKQEINEKIIGMTASNGIVIKSQSKHFIERVLGSVEDRRNGVELDVILNCLKNGNVREVKIDCKGCRSQKIEIENVCSVSINIDTGNIIQVNPYKRSKQNESI